MNDLIKTLGSDPKVTGIVIVFVVFISWMYKEMRNNFVESNKLNQARIDKALELYSDLDLEVLKLLNEKSDIPAVIEKVSKSVHLLPYELLKLYEELKGSEGNEATEKLINFQKQLGKEVYRLKLCQVDAVSYENRKGIFHTIEYYFKTMISPFLKPLLNTFINISLIFLLVVLIIFVDSGPTLTQKILNYSLIYVAIFYPLFLYTTVKFFINKRFRNVMFNWIPTLLYVVGLPCFVIYSDTWFRGIVAFVLITIYGFYIEKKYEQQRVARTF